MKVFLTILISLFLPVLVLADNATVINDISASVSTGGKSSVKVYTEVNGEVVEDFDKTFEGETKFEFASDKELGDTKVNTTIEMQTVSSTEVSKVPFDTLEEELGLLRKILNYVFSFFKF